MVPFWFLKQTGSDAAGLFTRCAYLLQGRDPEPLLIYKEQVELLFFFEISKGVFQDSHNEYVEYPWKTFLCNNAKQRSRTGRYRVGHKCINEVELVTLYCTYVQYCAMYKVRYAN